MNRYKDKPKRIYLENEFYFVTVKTQYNKSIFKDRHNAEIFSQTLKFLKNRGDFELTAGVLLPDHFHLLLMPIKKNISEIIHDLKSYTANQINHRRGRDASPGGDGNNNINQRQGLRALPFRKIWQRSFHYHIIINDWDFENHYNYITWNPEKHNCVSNLKGWPYLFDGEF